MSCINKSHPDFIKLQNETQINPEILAAKIGVWMDENSSEDFPTAKDLQLETVNVVEESEDINSKAASILGTDRSWPSKPDTGLTVSNEALQSFDVDTLELSEEDQDKFNVLASVVGIDEALRDYLEQNKEIRSPEIVFQKLLSRDYSNLEEKAEQEYSSEPYEYSPQRAIEKIKNIVNNSNAQKATSVVAKLSQQLGVNYEFISEEEFNKQYPGEDRARGFFKNGKVYLIENRYDKGTVFHEFSHPIIDSIYSSNRQLFDELYQLFEESVESLDVKNHLDANYTSLIKDSADYKKEALTYALQYAFENQEKVKSSSFIKNLFVFIKQFLRKMLGKNINISKLNSNTTLEDIAKMVNEGATFTLDTDYIDENDVVMFAKMYDDQVAEIEKIAADKTQNLINDFYTVVKKQVGNLTKENDIFKFIKDELADDYNEGILQQLRKDLESLATLNNKKPVIGLEFLKANDAEKFNAVLHQFVSILAKTEVLFDKFGNVVSQMENVTLDTKEDASKLYAIYLYIENWKTFYEGLSNDGGYFNDVSNMTELAKTFSSVKGKINSLKNKIDRIVNDAAIDAFYKHIVKENASIDKAHRERLAELERKELWREYENAHVDYYGLTTQELYEYEQLSEKLKDGKLLNRQEQLKYGTYRLKRSQGSQITLDKVKLTGANLLGDAKAASNSLWSFITSNDIVTNGFAAFLNDKFNEISGNYNAKESVMLDGLNDRLKKAGYTQALFGEAGFGKDISQVDKDFFVDENNKVVEDESYAFISNFKDYKFELGQLNRNVKEALEDYKFEPYNENKLNAWLDAVEAKEKFEADYMHREFKDEYYQHDHLLRTPIGRKAKAKLLDLYEQLNIIEKQYNDPMDSDYQKESQQVYFEIRQLKNRYDRNGELKTGDDLAIADLLTEYDALTADFHEYEEIPDKFELAFELFEETIAKAYPRDSFEYHYEIEKWLEANTQIEFTQSYYDALSDIKTSRENLLSELEKKNEELGKKEGWPDINQLHKDLKSILRPILNTSGSYDGTKLNEKEAKKVTEISQRIREVRDKMVKKSGLSNEQFRRYIKLSNKTARLTKDETKEYNALMLLMETNKLNLDDDVIEKLNGLDELSKELMYSESTQDYKNKFMKFLNDDSELFLKVNDFVQELYKHSSFSTNQILTDSMVKAMLDDTYFIDELFKTSPEFETWFKNNHYMAEKIVGKDYQNKRVVKGWVASAAWSYSGPVREERHMVTKMMNHPYFDEGVLKLHGKYRVPNITYKHKTVKAEYRTPVELRDHVVNGKLVLANQDNKGRWLPKTVEQGAVSSRFINEDYMKMFNEQPELFEAMDYLKNIYLDEQESLDNSQKNYLLFPRERAAGTEDTVFQLRKYVKRRISSMARWISGGEIDAFENELFTGKGTTENSPALDDVMTRPISGNYRMPLFEQSRNIVHLMGRWRYSVEGYKAAREINPMLNMINKSINELNVDPDIYKFRKNLEMVGLLKNDLAKDGKKNVRLNNLQKIIDKNIKGEQVLKPKGWMSDKGTFRYLKFIKSVSGLISKASFSFNIQASATNYGGGKSMLWLNSTNFHLINPLDLIKTKKVTILAQASVFGTSFSKKQKNPLKQLVMVMDAIPDFALKQAGRQGSSSVAESVLKGDLRYVDRKILGDAVPLHQFFALLHHNKFTMETTGEQKPLYEAIGLDQNGRIRTLKGVPKEYQISYNDAGEIQLGSRIKHLMNMHQELLTKTIGASNSLNSPEVYRTVIGRTTLFLVKFFPNLLRDRVAFKKVVRTKYGLRFVPKDNIALQQRELGFYAGALESIGELVRTKGRHLSYENYTALLKVGATILIDIATTLLIKSLNFNMSGDDDERKDFTYDPDRENMFSELRATTSIPKILPDFVTSKTGDLVNPRYTDVRSVKFDAEYYWKMQGLRLLTRVQREQRSFYPYQSLTQLTNMTFLKGVFSTGNPVSDFYKSIAIAFSDDSDYSKDAGPYSFQAKGSNKIWKPLMKYTIGIDGKVLDPAFGLKQENRVFY